MSMCLCGRVCVRVRACARLCVRSLMNCKDAKRAFVNYIKVGNFFLLFCDSLSQYINICQYINLNIFAIGILRVIAEIQNVVESILLTPIYVPSSNSCFLCHAVIFLVFCIWLYPLSI